MRRCSPFGTNQRLRRRSFSSPPRNVRAYSLAMQRAGVDLRERTAFLGLRTADGGWVAVEIKRAGKVYAQRFHRGKPEAPLAEIGTSDQTGTKVSFKPDAEIFERLNREVLGQL